MIFDYDEIPTYEQYKQDHPEAFCMRYVVIHFTNYCIVDTKERRRTLWCSDINEAFKQKYPEAFI